MYEVSAGGRRLVLPPSALRRTGTRVVNPKRVRHLILVDVEDRED
ncbi:MAG: hypothetical protein QW651_02990 [Candidatus Nezhaarchaeales archaeon]